jgi:hypothetical protein
VIEPLKKFLHRGRGLAQHHPINGLGPIHRALLVGIRADQAGIDREAFTTNKPLVDAATNVVSNSSCNWSLSRTRRWRVSEKGE